MADAGARARRLLFFYSSALLLASLPSAAQVEDIEFVPRDFAGEGNNVDNPTWGSTGTAQVPCAGGRLVLPMVAGDGGGAGGGTHLLHALVM